VGCKYIASSREQVSTFNDLPRIRQVGIWQMFVRRWYVLGYIWDLRVWKCAVTDCCSAVILKRMGTSPIVFPSHPRVLMEWAGSRQFPRRSDNFAACPALFYWPPHIQVSDIHVISPRAEDAVRMTLRRRGDGITVSVMMMGK